MNNLSNVDNSKVGFFPIFMILWGKVAKSNTNSKYSGKAVGLPGLISPVLTP